ncbi:MAG: class I SAM-dependent methyltransferase [Candidatus Sulfotelmatobacter sp.]
MQMAVAERSTSIATLCPSCGRDEFDICLEAPDRFHGRQKNYQLARCRFCSLVWLKDPPPPDEMGDHYGVDYDRAIAAAGDDPDHWTERRDALLKYKSGGSVLDLGCSSGGFLRSLKGPAWNLYGIEMSEEVARRAETATGAKVFVGDILDAPFSPNTFDVITCFHVFEHLYEPREVLLRVAQWLKPGGVFFAMMPNIDSAGRRIFGSYWYALELPRHTYHFSPQSLSRMADSVGLRQLSITTGHEVFIEQSVRYLVDELYRKLQWPRTPMARLERPGIPYRAVRKAFRLTVLPVLTGLASLVGDGESIHAVLTKA